MAQSTTQKLHSVLKQLGSSVPNIEALAVVSSDGLAIASQLPEGVEEDRVGAMSAAILSLGERSVQEMAWGNLNLVLVKGEGGFIVTQNLGTSAVLVTMSNENAKLGVLFLEINRAAEELLKIV